MASHVVQVERWQGTDMAFVRVRDYDAPEADKDVLRPIDHRIYEGTTIPLEHRPHAGALVSLMFFCQKRTVSIVEVRWFDGGPLWVADALVDDGDQVAHRRGVGATLIDALVALAFDVQMLD